MSILLNLLVFESWSQTGDDLLGIAINAGADIQSLAFSGALSGQIIAQSLLVVQILAGAIYLAWIAGRQAWGRINGWRVLASKGHRVREK